MGLHVYCITRPQRAPDGDLIGVGGAAVSMVTAADLGLWTSPHAARPAADADAIRAHNAVVNAAMDRVATPVPARFGQWFDDEAAARAKLVGEAARWHELLDRFAGRAEWGIRIGPPADTGGAVREMHRAATGTEHMTKLARRYAGTEARRAFGRSVAERIATLAGGAIIDSRQALVNGMIDLAHLLAWTDEQAYHSAVGRVRDELADVPFTATGPWPPYSFV